jgi:hypothetical protein
MPVGTYDAAVEEYTSIMGAPLGELIFPAMITGVAKPQFTTRPHASCRLADTQPECGDTDPYMDCSAYDTPNASGYYPDSFLPCGVWPARYRWRAEFGSASSETCGFRKTGAAPDEIWLPWRQAYYAINTAHVSQDRELDYPYIPPGTLVIMQFADLAALTGETGGPRFGFSFHHMSDPLGNIIPCPVPGPSLEEGCCQYGSPIEIICCSEDQCIVLGGWWQPTEDDCEVDVNCY